MRNITVSVDDDLYRRSRIRAAELDTSVSALVRDFLGALVDATPVEAEATEEQRRQRLHEVIAEFDAHGVGLRPAENLSREELHDRDRARAEAATAARDRGSDSR